MARFDVGADEEGRTMPMIDLTYLRGSVELPALERLTDELVAALLRAERAPGSSRTATGQPTSGC